MLEQRPRNLLFVCNFIKGKKADIALRDLEFSRKEYQKM
jgi:ribosomal protein L22